MMIASDRQILLVDDEKGLRDILSKILRKEGYGVITACDGQQAIDKVKNYHPALTFLDLKMSGMDGIETLSKIRKFDDESIIIILTAYGTIDSAVKATKLGAYDYITKPFQQEKIKILIQNALGTSPLTEKVDHLHSQVGEKYKFKNIVGTSKKMQQIYDLIEKVAPTDITVLLRGESGTGKELLAQAIHLHSFRKANPFVAIDVASLPGTLVESELFGYEKGAFTGAEARKLGKFELAQGGTIFLDEVGNLTSDLQVKLLRVLEQREIERVGGKTKIKLDIRLITATNTDLGKAVKKGTFREDLYYRINVFPIDLPLLRERREDIPLLIEYFLKEFRKRYNKRVKSVSSKVMKIFLNYDWPGNVRELKNAIESASLLADGIIQVNDLPLHFQKTMMKEEENGGSLKKTAQQVEKEIIIRALEKNNWNKSKTAKVLKIDYKTLYNKMKRYQINPPPSVCL
jgi:two-component system response regulator AtoC